MPLTPQCQLGHLNQAFEGVGVTYVPGWTGRERVSAPLGSRSQANHPEWERAFKARRILTNFARDGRMPVVMFDADGRRTCYFESSERQLADLLLLPDLDAPGLVEFWDGSIYDCEVDFSRLGLANSARKKPGPKTKFAKAEAICKEYLLNVSWVAPNCEIIDYARKEIGAANWPSKSYWPDIIDRVRGSVKPPGITTPA